MCISGQFRSLLVRSLFAGNPAGADEESLRRPWAKTWSRGPPQMDLASGIVGHLGGGAKSSAA
jgi:hypothetical protein